MKNKLTALPKPVKVLIWVLLALLAYALPILEPPILSTPDSDFASVLFTVSIYCLIALGLNIVVGYAGLLDLGYVGFYAIGAYTVAILTSFHASWPLLLAIPVAVVVTMISGVILGAPTLRVRGDYLAIVTLGFGEIIRLVAVNLDWLGGNKGIPNIGRPPNLGEKPDGLFEIPHLFWGNGTVLVDTKDTTSFLIFGYADAVPYYWVGLTAVILVLLADRLIKDSRVGRAWEATREDEDAAADEEGVAEDLPEALVVPDRLVVRPADVWAVAEEVELLEAGEHALVEGVVDEHGEIREDGDHHHVQGRVRLHVPQGPPLAANTRCAALRRRAPR